MYINWIESIAQRYKMALTSSPSALSVPKLVLPTPLTMSELEYGEYVYNVHLIETKTRNGNKKYEVDSSFPATVSALMNTSGGVIKILPPDPNRPFDEQLIDTWLNDYSGLLAFVPSNMINQLCKTFFHNGTVCILVHKAKQFITAHSHMYTRNQTHNESIKFFENISNLLNQEHLQASANRTRKVDLPLSGSLVYGERCLETESENLEFKFYGCNDLRVLLGRIKEQRFLKSVFGMANLRGGGDIILGIKEDQSRRQNTYKGQELDPEDESKFRDQLNDILTGLRGGCLRIWGDLEGSPQVGVHWACEFYPLNKCSSVCVPRCKTCPHKRRVLIQIHVFHCPRGMFECEPEAFIIDDDGNIKQVDVATWREIHVRQKKVLTVSKSSTSPAEQKSKTGNFPPKKPSATEGFTSEDSPLSTSVAFKPNTTLAFTEHSTEWKPEEIFPSRPDVVVHPEVVDLFVVECPVRYTPSRGKIISYLNQNEAVLTRIDGNIDGNAFGLAVDSLFCCISKSLSNSCTTKPPHHNIDLLIVSATGLLNLFVLCGKSDSELDRNMHKSYAALLSRTMKRRLIEGMEREHRDGDYASINVRFCVMYLSEHQQQIVSPDFYHNWFKSPSHTESHFSTLCLSLGKVLMHLPTCFSDIVKHGEAVRLSQQQIETLSSLAPNVFNFIEGPPGSGKTILAQHVCVMNGKVRCAYISASEALNNRARFFKNIDAYYASTGEDVLILVRGDLRHKQHLVIDDHHNFTYDASTLAELCAYVRDAGMSVYIFEDSHFQNYNQIGRQSLFKQFAAEHEDDYGTVSVKVLSEIHRNAQVIGSFLKAQVSDLVSGARAREIKFLSRVKGDNVFVHHVTGVRTQSDQNGLLRHVQSIIKNTLDAHDQQYSPRDIAVLVDNKDMTAAQNDAQLFRLIFREHWPDIHIQDSDELPVRGIIIDILERFMGLESRIVIFVEPTDERFENMETDLAKVYTKHRIAIASRGIDRVDFLHEDVLDNRIADEMKCNRYPASFVQATSAHKVSLAEPDNEDEEDTTEQNAGREINQQIEHLQRQTLDTETILRKMEERQQLLVALSKAHEHLDANEHAPMVGQTVLERTQQIDQRRQELDTKISDSSDDLLRMTMDAISKYEDNIRQLNGLQHIVLENHLLEWKHQQQIYDGELDEPLEIIQKWCENLVDITWQTRQQIKRLQAMAAHVSLELPAGPETAIPRLSKAITNMLATIVTSTLVIDKQPPRVLMKDTKFRTSVRFLVGDKLGVHTNTPSITADLISIRLARLRLAGQDEDAGNETSGDMTNNTCTMEFFDANNRLSATFNDMVITRVETKEEETSEIATENKMCLRIQTRFDAGDGELIFHLWTLSLPVIIITHRDQHIDASAAVFWDNWFAVLGRNPFDVSDAVTWSQLAQALNAKLESHCGVGLTSSHLNYLASKVFGDAEDYSDKTITWTQFNRAPLPKRNFTFWQYFYSIYQLITDCLRGPWRDGYIHGFLSREATEDLLLQRPDGTFLCRFSDSQLGAMSIAWVECDDTGEKKVWNLAPLTSRELLTQSLWARMKSMGQVSHLYPDIPMERAFGKYWRQTIETDRRGPHGYVKPKFQSENVSPKSELANYSKIDTSISLEDLQISNVPTGSSDP